MPEGAGGEIPVGGRSGQSVGQRTVRSGTCHSRDLQAGQRRDNSGKGCCRAIVDRLVPLYGSRRDAADCGGGGHFSDRMPHAQRASASAACVKLVKEMQDPSAGGPSLRGRSYGFATWSCVSFASASARHVPPSRSHSRRSFPLRRGFEALETPSKISDRTRSRLEEAR